MKISEITLEMIKDYINAPEEKDKIQVNTLLRIEQA